MTRAVGRFASHAMLRHGEERIGADATGRLFDEIHVRLSREDHCDPGVHHWIARLLSRVSHPDALVTLTVGTNGDAPTDPIDVHAAVSRARYVIAANEGAYVDDETLKICRALITLYEAR